MNIHLYTYTYDLYIHMVMREPTMYIYIMCRGISKTGINPKMNMGQLGSRYTIV